MSGTSTLVQTFITIRLPVFAPPPAWADAKSYSLE